MAGRLQQRSGARSLATPRWSPPRSRSSARLNTNSRYLQEPASSWPSSCWQPCPAITSTASCSSTPAARRTISPGGSRVSPPGAPVPSSRRSPTTASPGHDGPVAGDVGRGVTAAARPSASTRPTGDGPTRRSGIAAAVAELRDSEHGVAAMFVDGVFTSDGILGPAHAWTAAAATRSTPPAGCMSPTRCRPDIGRTGDHLWSWAASGLRPDLVMLGKPMGNGYPVAAVVGSAAVIDPFIETHRLLQHVRRRDGGVRRRARGAAGHRRRGRWSTTPSSRGHLRASLDELAARHPRLGAPRWVSPSAWTSSGPAMARWIRVGEVIAMTCVTAVS